MSAPFSHRTKPIRLKSRTACPTKAARLPTHTGDTTPISADTRLFVWQRDGGKCRSCGASQNLHFDHVIPRSWGGASTADNVQLLCRDCNIQKGASLRA